MKKLKENSQDIGLLILRLLMGCGIAYHGYGKVFGGFMDRMIQGVGDMGFPMPSLFAWAAALSEFAGGILVAVGLKTRIASAFIAITMLVAAFIAHGQDPFQKKELALAYLTVSLSLVFLGSGRFSLNHLLCKKSKS